MPKRLLHLALLTLGLFALTIAAGADEVHAQTFEITIDATALSNQDITVTGVATGRAADAMTIQVDPGTYWFKVKAGGEFDFSVAQVMSVECCKSTTA